ncbi:hypothetical protein B0T16DRAFT_412441 [Cercophora newfieldiana]|uniref:Uncharacterized protein n=1 Tax=Cercophora newfieldiana TaxID=92897 RepID=A0AA39Y4R6_9PEZI|nr:hypothetical protein B0T16DRAFT_412441 [Cercophora newfieldiana]
MIFGDGAVPHYRKRRCHVCGDKIIPQAFCPSCGHLLCGECRRSLTSATPIHGVPDTVLEAEDIAVDEGGVPFDPLESSVATPASGPVDVLTAVDEVKKFEEMNIASHGTKRTVKDPGRPEQALESVGMAPGVKRNSLTNNPFIIADQIAKAKVVQPQVTNDTVELATPTMSKANLEPPAVTRKPSKSAAMPETNRVAEAIRRMRRNEGWANPSASAVAESETKQDDSRQSIYRVTEATQHIRHSDKRVPRVDVTTESEVRGDTPSQSDMSELYGLSHKQLQRNSRDTNRDQQRHGLGPSTLNTDQRSPGVSTAGTSTEKTLSPGLRRVKVVQHKPSSGNLASVIEVDVAGDSQTVPRVRVSSPPSWLKQPTHTPGSIEGKLRRVASRERHFVSQQAGIDEVPQNQHDPQISDVQPPMKRRQSQQVRKAESQTRLRPSETKKTESQQQKTTVSTASAAPQSTRRASVGSTVPTPHSTSVSGTGERQYSWRQQARNLAAKTRLSETDMSPKSVSEVPTERNMTEAPDDSQLEDEDDIGIQGLTIVLQYVLPSIHQQYAALGLLTSISY